MTSKCSGRAHQVVAGGRGALDRRRVRLEDRHGGSPGLQCGGRSAGQAPHEDDARHRCVFTQSRSVAHRSAVRCAHRPPTAICCAMGGRSGRSGLWHPRPVRPVDLARTRRLLEPSGWLARARAFAGRCAARGTSRAACSSSARSRTSPGTSPRTSRTLPVWRASRRSSRCWCGTSSRRVHARTWPSTSACCARCAGTRRCSWPPRARRGAAGAPARRPARRGGAVRAARGRPRARVAGARGADRSLAAGRLRRGERPGDRGGGRAGEAGRARLSGERG